MSATATPVLTVDLPRAASEASPRPATLSIDIPNGDDWLSAEELASLTPAILRDRVKALQPLIAERARSVEISRRPDPEVWAALRKTGIFYMFVPKAYGGLEMDVEDLIEVMLPIAEACASTCWCATFSIEHNVGFVKAFPRAVQEKVFSKFPYIIAPGVQSPPGRAVPVDGGYRVSGHWKWGSGVMNSDWVLGGVLVDRGGPQPEFATVMIPSRHVSVPDSWFMAGMAGTGSNDIIVDDFFVPEEFLGKPPMVQPSPEDTEPFKDWPVTNIPFGTLLNLTTMLPALGVARAAVSLALSRVTNRTVMGTQTRYSEKEALQTRFGHAETLTRSADVLLRDSAKTMMKLGRTGSADFEQRSAIRSQIMLALGQCREAVRSVADASGASAQQLDCPMQRYLRDIQVICTHALYDADLVFEQRGRALLGLPGSDILT